MLRNTTTPRSFVDVQNKYSYTDMMRETWLDWIIPVNIQVSYGDRTRAVLVLIISVQLGQ